MEKLSLKEVQYIKDQYIKDYIKLGLKYGLSKVTSKLEKQIKYYQDLENHLLHDLPAIQSDL